MRREEISAFGELAGDAAGGLASQIQQMHSAVAKRVWRAVGPGAAPARVVHDEVATRAYAAARGLSSAVVRAGARALGAAPARRSRVDRADRRRPGGGRRAQRHLGRHADAPRQQAGAEDDVARRGARCSSRPAPSCGAAYPHATPRLAVFVHGLCETDDAWMLGGERHVPYGFRLQAELGYTPLYVRYNTGLHISENGRELAGLLDPDRRGVAGGGPRDRADRPLDGRARRRAARATTAPASSGRPRCATCSRSARRTSARRSSRPPTPPARRSRGCPETRALLADPLNRRSAGIKDLRYGYLVDECWLDRDCDAFLRDTGREIPFLRTAHHYFVCATVSRDPNALAGRIVGDLLVLRASAWSQRRGKRLQFPVEHYHHVGGANHFELLNHPAIYEQIRRWMAPRPALSAAAA